MKLCFEQLRLRSHHQVFVDGLDFALEHSQIAAIVGPSQSGKSTLLLMAAGYMSPDNGRVFILHDDDSSQVVRKSDWRTVGLGPIANLSPLFETLTVREHLSYQLRLHQHSGRKQRVEELLEAFHLTRVQGARIKDIDQFSQFRTALANTAAHRPSFILLDEPERGLSSTEWAEAQQMLKTLCHGGIGILYTTVLESAADWVDHRIHLPSGEVSSIVDTHSDGH